MNEKGKPSRGVCVCEVGGGGRVKQLLHFENIVDETGIKVARTCCGDMSQGQISSCVMCLKHVATTKNCPCDTSHKIKLI